MEKSGFREWRPPQIPRRNSPGIATRKLLAGRPSFGILVVIVRTGLDTVAGRAYSQGGAACGCYLVEGTDRASRAREAAVARAKRLGAAGVTEVVADDDEVEEYDLAVTLEREAAW